MCKILSKGTSRFLKKDRNAHFLSLQHLDTWREKKDGHDHEVQLKLHTKYLHSGDWSLEELNNAANSMFIRRYFQIRIAVVFNRCAANPFEVCREISEELKSH